MQTGSATSAQERGQRQASGRGRRRLAAVLAGLTLVAGAAAVTADLADAAKADKSKDKPKNVIVLISDGMGYNTMLAGDYFQYGAAGTQQYERFPVRKAMSTYSIVGGYDPLQAWGLFNYFNLAPTDSAAAATAMSTGVKTYDAAIGVDNDQKALYHVAQRAEALKKSTGVVSTVQWSHATPAGFVAHNVSRNDYEGLAKEMVNDSATDVIMGAGHPLYDNNGTPLAAPGTYKYVGGETTWNALVNGTAGGDADGDGDADPWKLIQSRFQFERLAHMRNTPARVCGTVRAATTTQQSRAGDDKAAPYTVPMNANVPDLRTMTKGALNVLDNNRRGFFLMVEGGAVDWAGHANQPGRIIEKQIDFNQAVNAVCRWVKRNSSWNETLVIVTADHETGYLWGPGTGADASGNGTWIPVANNGEDTLPGMQFNSGNHTNSLVPLFARGAGATVLETAAEKTDAKYGAYLDSTEIARTIFSVMR
jgi:alkaline phosphatase